MLDLLPMPPPPPTHADASAQCSRVNSKPGCRRHHQPLNIDGRNPLYDFKEWIKDRTGVRLATRWGNEFIVKHWWTDSTL
jgi:hypothetical protein